MSCDCEHPEVYRAKTVKVKKLHRCCECGHTIKTGEQAEKVDALWNGSFSSIYTCLSCVDVRNYIQQSLVDNDDDCLCHEQLFDYLYDSDLLWDEDEIEEEASQWVIGYSNSLGVIRGVNKIIGTKVDWLSWRGGRLHLVNQGEGNEDSRKN